MIVTITIIILAIVIKQDAREDPGASAREARPTETRVATRYLC